MSLLLVACQADLALPTGTPEARPRSTATAEQTIGSYVNPTPLPVLGEAPQGPTVEALVVDIVDGDTIKVEIGGTVYPLRYIGIDSPQVGLPYADQATTADEQLVGGATVLLEKDVSETDRFDRLLRYVWLAHGERGSS
jgi:micrococcal nuclease